MFLEVCATRVQLEVVKLDTITPIAQKWFVTKVVKNQISEHVVQLSMLPYIVQPRAFLEVSAGYVLLEVVNLSKIANVAQNGVARRSPKHIVLNSLNNFKLFVT